jgi:hypothetical protein
MLPSALLTASASQQAEFSELNLHGLLPCCVRFAPTSHPVNGNTRYRPACSLWPCGTCTRWTPSRGFTVSASAPPLPSFSQRDNNVGSVDPSRPWFVDDQRLERKEPNIMIIGVDFHPSFQAIAFCVQETGECGEQELSHSDGQAEKYYRDLKQRGIRVRVGTEATGYSR